MQIDTLSHISMVQSTGVGVKLTAYSKVLECNVWQLFLF